jgi:hypothetical protein
MSFGDINPYTTRYTRYLKIQHQTVPEENEHQDVEMEHPNAPEEFLLHIFNRSDSDFIQLLEEASLHQFLPLAGWYDLKKHQIHFFKPIRVSRQPFYLRTHADAPVIKGMTAVNYFTDQEAQTTTIATNLHDYALCRQLRKSVKFCPLLLSRLQSREVNGSRSGILVVDPQTLPPDIVDNITHASTETFNYTSTMVSPDDSFLTRKRRADDFLELLQQTFAIITNDPRVAVTALFQGAFVIVATLDPKPFVDTGMSFLMAIITPDLLYEHTILHLREKMRRNAPRKVVAAIQDQISRMSLWDPLTMPGTSIVAVCMNRNEHLLQSIVTWQQTSAKQIIVIDWGSTTHVIETLSNHIAADARIFVHRVGNVDTWILSHAYNFGIRMAQYTDILKVDCDSLLAQDIIENHPLHTNAVFYCGNWKTARDENEMHTNGVMYVTKADFLAVNGYNEYIITYGYDDSDLYERLDSLIPRKNFLTDAIVHIAHDDISRVSQQRRLVADSTNVEIERNRIIADRFPWSRSLPPSIIAFEYPAGYHSTVFTKLQTVVLPPATRDIILQEARQNQAAMRKRLYGVVQMGLGNRMRALASLYVIGKNAAREFVLIWKMDEHCEASFADVFSTTSGSMENVRAFTNISMVAENAVSVIPVEPSSDCTPSVLAKSSDIDNVLETAVVDVTVATSNVVFSKYRTWEEEDVFLRELTLEPRLMETLAYLKAELDFKDIIGIHVRVGQNPALHTYEDTTGYEPDAQMEHQRWRTASSAKVFIAEMQRYLAHTPAQVFFVASDTQETIDEMVNVFGNDRVKYYKRVEFDRSVQQVKAAAVDIYALGSTREIWGSNWSSFTEIACRIAGVKPRLAGVDF